MVGKNERATLEENALRYFYSSPARGIWVKTVEKANQVEENKVGPLTRSMLNKFETMLSWLSQLDLIRKGEKLWLTSKGLKFLEGFSKDIGIKEISSKIYSIAAQLYSDESIQYFELTRHRDNLVNKLREGNRLFQGEQGLSDIIAVQEFVSAIFAANGIVLEEGMFYEIIQKLALEGIVKSIILGRDGKPAFLVMD